MGDVLNTNGLKLNVTYSDNSSKTITDGFTVSGFDSSSVGDKTVKVSYGGKTASFKVTVKSPSVSLSYSSIVLNEGDTYIITANTTPFSNNVKWFVSDSNIIEVTNGQIKAISSGTATVTAEFDYNGYKSYAKCQVCVNNSLPSTKPNTESTFPTKPEVKIQDTSKIFTDVVKGKWYKEYIDYAYSYGFFKGMTETTFEPNTTLTRAMFVTVLSRISGDSADNSINSKFSDVKKGKWYTGAVVWANKNGIVNGISNTKFGTNSNITREQMCTMLIRFAKYKNIALNKVNKKAVFADDSSISDWAKEQVYVCQSANIVNGSIVNGKNVFNPKGNATRAEASKILSVFHKDYM